MSKTQDLYKLKLRNIPKEALDEINEVVNKYPSITSKCNNVRDSIKKVFKIKDLSVGDKIEFPVGTLIYHNFRSVYKSITGSFSNGEYMEVNDQTMILRTELLALHRLEFNMNVPNPFNKINTSFNHFGPLAEVVRVDKKSITFLIQSVVGGTVKYKPFNSTKSWDQWNGDKKNYIPTRLSNKKFRIEFQHNEHL